MNYQQLVNEKIKNIHHRDRLNHARIAGFASWIVPLAPAIAFGFAFYQFMMLFTGSDYFGIVAGLSAGLGLIIVGIASTYAAVRDHRGWWLVAGYIVLEIIGLWVFGQSIRFAAIATVISLLTLIAYIAVAMTMYQFEAQSQQVSEVDFSHTLKEKQQADNLTVRLARVEAEKAVKLAAVQPAVKLDSQLTSASPSIDKATLLQELSRRQPDVKVSNFAKEFGISRQTVYNWLDELKQTNGKGNNHV